MSDDHHGAIPPPDPDVKASLGMFMWGFAGFGVLVVTVLVLTGYFWVERELEATKKATGSPFAAASETLRTVEQSRLGSYAKLKDGQYQIPIERAMKLVASEARGKK